MSWRFIALGGAIQIALMAVAAMLGFPALKWLPVFGGVAFGIAGFIELRRGFPNRGPATDELEREQRLRKISSWARRP